MERWEYAAPCLFGIEGILGDELKRMDAQDVRVQNGRVLFSGGPELLARANIGSRYAERIQLHMGSFRAVSFDELFEGVRALPWENWIGKKDAFPVKGWSLNSALHSVPDCQSIIKKAIVERLKGVYGLSWFEESGAVVQVQFTLLKDEATLLLDTSGPGLHKRGYRQNAGGAPIKETLAAAMVDLTRARLAERVVDPCCGSGTLLIEAALAAKRIAPGIRRRFAAMQWGAVPSGIWEEERSRAREQIRRDAPFEALGGDTDPEAVRLTLENAEKAGVGKSVTAAVRDLRAFVPEGESGVVLCNPPYGERIGDRESIDRIYKMYRRFFETHPTWSLFAITADKSMEAKAFGRPADRRRKLYNGRLEVCYYQFHGQKPPRK